MAQVIGTIRSVIGEVKVKNPLTGEERILSEGDQVFQGELLLTGPIGSVSLELANGETLSLGRASSLNLSDELVSMADSPLQAETVTSIEALRQAIFESNGPIEVEATAAGDDESSLQAAVVIDRLGLEGQVDTAFDTSATNAFSIAPITQLIGGLNDQVGNILDLIVKIPGQDGDDTGLEDIIKDLIDDLINIVDGVIDDVFDLLDDLIGQIEDLIDNGIDLLEDLIDIVVELVQDLVDVVTDIVNDLVDGLENIVDQVIETVSDLIDDASGIIDQVVGSVDGLLENLNELLTDVTDTAGNVLDNVGGLLESLLGGEPEDGTAGTVDQIVDLITDQVDGLLGTNTGSLDDGLNSVTTDVQELLTGDQALTEVVDSLLGGEPEAGTAGSVDQAVAGATDLVDQLIGTDTENLDDGLNALTTDVEELLTGDQTLTEVVDSLLGGEPEEGTAGSVDQVVAGATDLVDQLVGTDTENLDDGLNAVTTDVEELLTGDQTLTEVVDSLLGGEPEAGTAGSVDRIVDGATDLVDQLVGTDTENLDDGLNAVTTDVQDLLTGEQTLTEVVDSLLGGAPEEETAGSIDQVVDGTTDLVDQLLGTDTSFVDDTVNTLTSLVSDILDGDNLNLISLDSAVSGDVETEFSLLDGLYSNSTELSLDSAELVESESADSFFSDLENLVADGTTELTSAASNESETLVETTTGAIESVLLDINLFGNNGSDNGGLL